MANDTITITPTPLQSVLSGDFSGLISTQSTAQLTQYNVNLAPVGAAGLSIIERTPPADPYSGPFDFAGFGFGLPSTPRTARGIIEGTQINYTNQNLSHGCMIFGNLGMLSGGIISDISQLLTLPPSRIQASAMLRVQFNGIIQGLQAAIAAILETLGFDPTGMISYLYSQAKALLRMINYWLMDIKQLVSDMMAIFNFIQQLYQIIQYLMSLPAQLLSVVQSCISGFLNSVIGLSKSVENLPNTLENQVLGSSFNNISNFANQSLSSINEKSNNYKQNNPNYKNIDITTATPAQMQTLISSVATTDANSYSNSFNSIANSNAVKQSSNPQAYIDNTIYSKTTSQNTITSSITYDVVYANNIFANNIICNNLIVNQNTIANVVISNVLNVNTQIKIYSNTIPKVNSSNAISPSFGTLQSNNKIVYHQIYTDTITANTIICDTIMCNNTINVLQTMNTHSLLYAKVNSNTIIITS